MATPYDKTWGEVFDQCRSLTPLDRRACAVTQTRAPDPTWTCGANEAFVLYLADVLRFEKHDPAAVCVILHHFKDRLLQIGAELALAILERRPQLPVHRLSFSDGRFVSLTGEPELLDVENWTEVPGPVSELKLVSYNLTSLMLVRWAGVPLSPRLETSEPSDADTVLAPDAPPGS